MTTKAKRRAAIAPEHRAHHIHQALHRLRAARDVLRQVGSKRAADRVAAAIKSAEGAHRHAARADISAKTETRR